RCATERDPIEFQVAVAGREVTKQPGADLGIAGPDPTAKTNVSVLHVILLLSLLVGVHALAQPFETNPQDERPAAHVLEFLLDLVDELGGRALERGVAVGRGTGGEARAETDDEAVEGGVEVRMPASPRACGRAAAHELWRAHGGASGWTGRRIA